MMHKTETRGVALVTGGRRGIGKGICLALAEAGWDVAVNDIEHDELMQATLDEISAKGVRAIGVAGDISLREERERIVSKANTTFGAVTCLVNNAGISVKVRGDILNVTEESYDHVMAVNLKANFFLTQLVARQMLDSGQQTQGRCIINISSSNSVLASPERAEYCLSKTGISMATKMFAVRLAAAGVNVYEIRPGVIESDMTQVVRAKYDERIANGLTPIARIGRPDDVGKAVAAIAKGMFPFSTGEHFNIDGGLHIHQL